MTDQEAARIAREIVGLFLGASRPTLDNVDAWATFMTSKVRPHIARLLEERDRFRRTCQELLGEVSREDVPCPEQRDGCAVRHFKFVDWKERAKTAEAQVAALTEERDEKEKLIAHLEDKVRWQTTRLEAVHHELMGYRNQFDEIVKLHVKVAELARPFILIPVASSIEADKEDKK